ncbi:MAG: hypothetical protein IT361_00595 [Gemmatimonadaceae bacterium]|nr:hypothetical protein [Gemmatimonadaceae bacterium]
MSALPPYALTPPTFRFRALVALAERLPLGGERELVLATFVAARVLWAWSGAPDSPGAAPARTAAARLWLQSMSLPAPCRSAFVQLVDAVARGERSAVAAAWERALALSARTIDGVARTDLRALAGRLAPAA